MSDGTPDSPALAPGTEALIEALLRRQEPPRLPRPTSMSVDLLVRYLCRVLPATEARLVEQSLTRSSEARRSVRETRLLLDRLQGLSWDATVAIGQGDSREAETARAWMALASRSSQAMAEEQPAVEAGVQSAAGGDVWAEVKIRAERGGVHAQALWTTLLAFGAQLQTQMQGALPALARNSADTLPIRGTWQGECRLFETHSNSADALHLSAALTDLDGAPATEFSGWRAYLALLAGGEILLCAAATLEDDQMAWTATGITAGMGLGGPSFPAHALVLLIGPPEMPLLPLPSVRPFSQRLFTEGFLVASAEPPAETEEGAGFLAATILTAQGRESSLPPAPLEVLGPPPNVEKERLRIAVRVPAITRSAYAEGYRLLLDMAIAPRQWQHLDSWPLDDWGDSARSLSISCPGLPDGALASLTLLRARLAPLETAASNAS